MKKRELTDAAKRARDTCKNCHLREGDNGTYVVRFSSHPGAFKNVRTGEVVTLSEGYGLYRKETGKYECDIKNGRPVPFESYWEALAEIYRPSWEKHFVQPFNHNPIRI